MLKLVRLTFFLSVVAIIGYYVAEAQDESEKKASVSATKSRKKNISKNVCYKRRFNGGMLLFTSKEVTMQTKEDIFLSGIKASFTKNGKTVSIESGKCDLKPKLKKAYLQSNVIVKSADTTCCTESAVVDFSASMIFGKSKVTGMNARGSFVSDGFSVDKDGIINLKNVEIKGKKR